MKQYNNGQRKAMSYGGMPMRKPMMKGGIAKKKPRKKMQMGGMSTTQQQQNMQQNMMPTNMTSGQMNQMQTDMMQTPKLRMECQKKRRKNHRERLWYAKCKGGDRQQPETNASGSHSRGNKEQALNIPARLVHHFISHRLQITQKGCYRV